MDIDGIRPRKAGQFKKRSVDGFGPAPVRRRPASQSSLAPVASTPKRRPPATAVQPVSPADAKRFLLPKYHAPERPQKIVKKRHRGLRIFLQAASVGLALFLATGGFLVWKGYTKFHKVFHGTTTVAALSSKRVAPQLLNGEGDGRVNILLLGVGGPGHDGPDLTDTIVILSVDPVNDTATMVSIPRDLWVDMPINYFGKQQKINAAYESGKYHYIGHLDPSNKNAAAVQAGFGAIDTTLKQVLNININYHVLVNFQAFRQAIDTVGGVTVDVPTALVDPTMAWENHWNPVLAPAGVQQMNGVQALLYARSRETSSDFARAERQRQILVALKDKVLTAGTLSNPAKIDGLMNAFGDNVYSDLSSQGAVRLMGIMKKMADNKVDSVGLTDEGHQLVTTDHVGTASVVRPIAGFGNYTAIQTYVRTQMPDGYIVKENAPITVLAPTTTGATADAALLKTYGYNVTTTAVTDQPVPTVMLVDLSKGKDPYTRHYLETRYNVKAVTSLSDSISVNPGSAKFVIIESK
ncbi:MAG TPA: LCP family protein [Candidatus Saccharimonadales bacterium]|nr:LCP family protein [Candidatus Saccharimonadales bacterium]